MYVVIDTNVIVSALLKPDSIPGMVMGMVEDLLITPVFDDEIMSEYIEVLHRPKFDISESLIYDTILNLRSSGVTSSQYAEKIEEKFVDEEDKKFYLVTLESRKKRDTNLTTGNLRHFPIKPFIISPKDLVNMV